MYYHIHKPKFQYTAKVDANKESSEQNAQLYNLDMCINNSIFIIFLQISAEKNNNLVIDSWPITMPKFSIFRISL